ncbi:mycofactocin system GMC family oxidoreductase MftG [Mycobacterium sp.]|uniref:mycofactocin dehydrogenase MftG n=1 Tax=Mycobacterium sp. TaxID=1785 RepID=UPI003A85037A
MSADRRHSDVLVIGAGSAGSVVGERLSADNGAAVRVLEAGSGPADPELQALRRNGLRLPIGEGSPLAERYLTRLTGHPPREVSIVRGRGIGGSGAVNGGYFCWGLPGDFDRYAIPGWTWPEVCEHYRAIETDLDFPTAAHGRSGPIPVRRTIEMSDATEVFVDAAKRAGYLWLPDLNDVGTQLPSGVGAVPLNIVDGVRFGSGAAFLMPALRRRNLDLVELTRAVRLRFSGATAIGVDAVGPDGDATFTADRIVLCAGTINSAQLLMLSGVGEESMLRQAGVKPVAPLPVGRHCSDHPEWIMPTEWPDAIDHPALEVVLTTGDGIEIRPYTSGFGVMTGGGGAGARDGPHIGVALMRPKSRGRLSLLSSDPRMALRIEHRYDSEPSDDQALRSGSELTRELLGATTNIGQPVWSSSQHMCGSAPMGVEGDPSAVVDSRCRVLGLENLWVIDGSILPVTPSRGPHATIAMAGHRAAEFVV